MKDRKKELVIPVAHGELFDKIAILEIKAERIAQPVQRANIKKELDKLQKIRDAGVETTSEIERVATELRRVNETLWVIEDEIRLHEKNQKFDEKFIELARSVYRNNDKRADLKRKVNDLLGSEIVEEKSYEQY